MTASSPSQRRVPQWLMLMLRGVAAVLFGLYLIFSPVSALLTLVQLASIYFLIDGVIRFAGAFSDRDAPRRMPRLILGGIEVATALIVLGSFILQLTLGAGIVTLLGIIIGLQAVAGGVIAIIAALQDRTQKQFSLWAGISGVAFGAVLIAVTAMDDLAIVPFIGLLAVTFGGINIFLGWRQRSNTSSSM